MTITLYDIATHSGFPVSPSTWKARYSLNYKGIPYKTEWVEMCDIEALSIKLGISPTSTRADGSPFYTLPAIHDPSTGAYVVESYEIAVYLDKTYPDTPKLFPNGTVALQRAFTDTYSTAALSPAVFPFLVPAVGAALSPRGSAYFRRIREKQFGKTLEELAPKGEAAVEDWAKFRDGLAKADSWYARSDGPFLLGDAPSWADFVLAAAFIWMRSSWGENSQEWKDITTWYGGRWKKFLESLQKYETIA